MTSLSSQDPALARLLDLQKAAFERERNPSLATRHDRIDRLIEMLLSRSDEFVQAIGLDFRHRSPFHTSLVDVTGIVPGMKETRKRLKEWMRPDTKSSGPLALIGASARIEWQPLGVVGVIAPWNFPINLALIPACQALAAGNRVMLKLSENTPRTSELLCSAIASSFDPDELVAITGGVETGVAFSRLAFNHLMFTGASSVGRKILHAAADNLVPVTLELGGKCPTLLAEDGDLSLAARCTALGKVVNAGQICLAPDYALVPKAKLHSFVAEYRAAFTRMLPTLKNNEDYTAIINDAQANRLQSYLDDAVRHGAEVIEINPANESLLGTGKIVPALVLGATPQMKIMQEEIFGPLLPVLPYTDIQQAIAHINAGPRPLGAYYFGQGSAGLSHFLQNTHSGGVTVNDVFHHAGNEELPFGGVGDSGMGSYHGVHGFRTFSHARAVQVAPRFSLNFALIPPHGERVRWMIRTMRERELSAVRKRLAARGDRRRSESPVVKSGGEEAGRAASGPSDANASRS